MNVPGVGQNGAEDERQQQESNGHRRTRQQPAPSQNEQHGDGENRSQDDVPKHIRHVENRG
jgi:hypothetical protein